MSLRYGGCLLEHVWTLEPTEDRGSEPTLIHCHPKPKDSVFHTTKIIFARNSVTRIEMNLSSSRLQNIVLNGEATSQIRIRRQFDMEKGETFCNALDPALESCDTHTSLRSSARRSSVADARRGHPRAPLEHCRVVMSTRSKRAHRRSRSSSESLSDEPPAKIYASSRGCSRWSRRRLCEGWRGPLRLAEARRERLSPGARTGIFNLSGSRLRTARSAASRRLCAQPAKRPPSSSGLSTILTESLGVQTRSVCTPPRTRASGLDTADDISSVVDFAPCR